MRFLGGLLKVLAIIILVAATAICTAVSVAAQVMEAYITMGVIWVCALLVALNILGTGIALTRLRKLEKKVEQLEQRMAAPVPYQYGHRENSYENIREDAIVPLPAPEGEPVSEPVPAPVPAPAPKKKGAGLWIALAVVAVVAVAGILAAVLLPGNRKDTPETTSPVDVPQTEPAEEVPCAITVNGICVDDSYVDDDGSSLKLVYLFYTIRAEGSNLEIDSKYTTMHIGENTYESDNFADVAAACKYTANYYYGSYIRDVYVGESMNVVATFYIPQGDLEPGKTVTLEDHQIPGVENLVLSTDEFMHFTSSDEIAVIMDPEGYEMSMYAREEADAATAKLVKNQLNGYYWSFFVNNTSYKLEFRAPNTFSVTTALGTSTGTYSVRNGFVFCTYPDTGYTVEIPYTLVDGKLDLDTIGGFDVMG